MSRENRRMIDKELGRCIFSIAYNVPGDDDYWAVDWSVTKEKWTRSCKEYGLGHCWEFYEDIDEYAYEALVAAFGLSKSDITLKQISVLSPRSLARIGTMTLISVSAMLSQLP